MREMEEGMDREEEASKTGSPEKPKCAECGGTDFETRDGNNIARNAG